jgi:small subunit ribosomal protein S20
MANIRSAEKQRRQAEKRKVRNTAAASRLKSSLRKVRAAVAAGQADLSAGFSVIDKAAKRRVIKKNTADRYKARLSAAAKRATAK